MSEQEIEQGGEEQGAVTASYMLSSAREALGLSQKEVADQLYLTLAFIKHIDEGAFEKIAKPAFIRGYLRSYARTVEISGDEVVACYEEVLQAAEENVQIRDVTEETVGSVAITGPVFQTGLVGLFGVVIMVGMVWWIVSSGEETEVEIPQVTSQADPEPVPKTIDEVNRNDIGFVLQQNETAEIIEFNDEGSGGDAVSASENSAVEFELPETSVESYEPLDPSNISIERHRDGGIHYIIVDANGFDEVEATFLEDCWLEVEDGNGDPIYGDLNKSGDVLRIYGVAPFKLLIGRATAVTLTFNGDDIDLAGYTAADETAKITLTRQP